PESKDPAADFARGRISFTMHGHKLKGAFALVRTAASGKQVQWLLMKKKDDAATGDDVTAMGERSVTSGRDIDEIREGKSAVWHSNRATNASESDDAAGDAIGEE